MYFQYMTVTERKKDIFYYVQHLRGANKTDF